MFKGIKDKWDNRGTRCLKCQKKLVATEKYLCKKCQSDLDIAGKVTLGTLLVYGIAHIPKVIKRFNA